MFRIYLETELEIQSRQRKLLEEAASERRKREPKSHIERRPWRPWLVPNGRPAQAA